MRIDEYVAILQGDGELMAEAVAKADPDAHVPFCPDWSVRELTHHMGAVHRWATAHVRDGRLEPIPKEEEPVVWGPMPDDAALAGWLRTGHAALVATLTAAPEDLACWSFLPAPSPLAFWARRQAHETAIHRADAQAAVGAVDGWPTEFAVDGIEELLFGFYGRPSAKLRQDRPQSLALRATDADLGRTLHIGPEGLRVDREAGRADGAIEAPAVDLYLLLWNRRTLPGLAVEGDPSLLDAWRRWANVRWSGTQPSAPSSASRASRSGSSAER
jgi:uncharacterized protein (TIGR03083 family)